MAAITVEKYLEIAGHYADAQDAVQGVSDFYYNAAYEIVLMQVFDPEIDLLIPFYNAYLTAQTVIAEPPSTIITAVNRLQQHVLDKARYSVGVTTNNRFTNINDWLSASVDGVAVTRDNESNDSAVTVPCQFAKLSEKAGYSISTDNITEGVGCDI